MRRTSDAQRIYCSYRIRHSSPDAKRQARTKLLYLRRRKMHLRLQRLPVHEAEYTGKIISLCMKYELPEVTMDEALRVAAKKPIERMLEISAQVRTLIKINN